MNDSDMAILKYWERKVTQCHFFHHKSHMDWSPRSELGLDSGYVLCCIIPCVNTEFFLHPLQIHNGCPSLFYETPPPFQHVYVVCRSPTCSYLSFPNGSTLSLSWVIKLLTFCSATLKNLLRVKLCTIIKYLR